MNGALDRSQFRNPSPPPGYIRPNPHIGFRPGLEEIDVQSFKFLALTIESGILEDSNPSSDFTITTSDDDDDVVPIPVPPKVPPVIDLEAELSEISDGDIPDAPKSPPVAKEQISENRVTKKDKDVKSTRKGTPSPSRVKKHHSKRKEKWVECSSDDSSESASNTKKMKKETKHKRHSRLQFESGREKDSDYEEQRCNSALVKQEDNLYGLYFCTVCKLNMNSEGTYQSHMTGKRHKKAINQQEVPKAVSDLLTSNNIVKSNRYPTARPNIVRKTVPEMAKVQRAVQDNVTPCPGLENVIEIQGLDERHYYCKLCDAPCASITLIPHLRGRKHQLQCLKHFDELTYESIKNMSNKRKLDGILLQALKTIERSQGTRLMMVEKEIEERAQHKPYRSQAERTPRKKNERPPREVKERAPREEKERVPREEKERVPREEKERALREEKERPPRIEDIPGPSHRYFDVPDDRRPVSFAETMVPDTSKSDFYCPICDSHMNNIRMWEAHIIGKRHSRNVKKAPGEVPSKAKSYAIQGARALIMDRLDEVMEPVVGLEFMRETQNPEIKGAFYNCFLCGACLTQLDVIDHILTQKHRTKFLEKINHPDMDIMSKMNIPENRLGSIIEETCQKEQNMNGRGQMEVHKTKNPVAWW